MDDMNTAVASRATILLESLHDGSLKLLCWCLEQQFDSFIADRPLLLQSVLALHHHPWLAKRSHFQSWTISKRSFGDPWALLDEIYKNA